MKTRKERIEIVNRIIKEIASRGRKFFHSKRDSDVAYILQKNGRLYMFNEYKKVNMALATKYGYPPKHWSKGGTLWGLTKDFKEFIMKGGDTNHNNGYGGLHCQYWGYDREDMIAIQELAIELGYLTPPKTN